MAVSTVQITGKVVIPGTTQGIRAQITATPMTNNAALRWPTEGVVSWGPVTVETNNDGEIPGAGLNIPVDSALGDDVLWRLVARPIDGKLRAWQMGTFVITDDADLADDDFVPITPVAYTAETVTMFEDLVADAEAASVTAVAAAATATALATSDGQTATNLSSGPLSIGVLQDAYVGRYTTIDVVADHGADPTGVVSAVTAMEAAIAAANARGGNCDIRVPGTINLKAGLTAGTITTPGVRIRGDARKVATILVEDGTLFRWDSNASGGGIEGVRFWCQTAPATSSLLWEVLTAERQTFENIDVDNVYKIAKFGTTGFCSQPTLANIRGYTNNLAGSVGLDFINGAVATLRDYTVFANCGFPANATDPHPAAAGTIGVRFGHGNWDTAVFTNVNLNRYDIDLDFDVLTGEHIGNMWFTDVCCDYAKTNGVRFQLAAGANGIRSLYFKGLWAVGTDSDSVLVDATNGVISHLHFADSVGRQAGKNNWRLLGGNMSYVNLRDCHGLAANRLGATNTGNSQDDLVILGSGVAVRGGYFGEAGTGHLGFTNTTRYGLNIAPDIDVVVEGVEGDGTSGGFAISANAAGSRKRLINRNRLRSGSAPSYATQGAVTAPTSAATTTHTASTVDTLHIHGGTVTAITHNGGQVGTTGPASIRLLPGDTWAITYSVAPTIRRVVEA